MHVPAHGLECRKLRIARGHAPALNKEKVESRVPRFESDRPGERAVRLIGPAQLLQGGADVGMGVRTIRCDCDRLFVACQRFVVTIQCLQGGAEITMRFRAAGIDGQDPAIARDRILITIVPVERAAAPVQGLGVVRIYLKCLLVTRNRGSEALLLMIDTTEAAVCLGIVGIDGERALKAGDSLVAALLSLKRVGEPIIGLDTLGIDGKRRLVGDDGLLSAFQDLQGRCQVRACLRRIRVLLDRRLEEPQRLLRAPLLQADGAKVQQSRKIPPITGEDLAIQTVGLAQFALFVQRTRLVEELRERIAAAVRYHVGRWTHRRSWRACTHGNGSWRRLNAIEMRGRVPSCGRTVCGR